MDPRLRRWFLGLTISVTALVGPTHLMGQTAKDGEMRQRFLHGQEVLNANHPDVAEKEFREVVTLDPKNAEALANLGLIAFGQARYEEAASSFRKAIALKPSLWSAQASFHKWPT